VKLIGMLGRGLWQSLRIMARNRVGFAGFLITLVIVVVAFTAPSFVELDRRANVEQIYQAPSIEHPLGTDYQGRDILKQILNGGREVIYVAAFSAFLVVLIAIVLGSLSAILGGWVDSLVNAAAELVLTIPHFPLLMVLAGFIRLNSPAGLAVILAGIGWGTLTRTIRAQVLSLKERDYVQAARALGLPTSHLLFREIMPNMMSYLLTQFVLTMTGSIYAQVGLIFLGIIPLATHNWGVMINLAWTQGAIYGTSSVWYLIAPISVIVILQFALISMNRSLEELFNPRLRGGE
jgi:peptide/nickel transport system permease protein